LKNNLIIASEVKQPTHTIIANHCKQRNICPLGVIARSETIDKVIPPTPSLRGVKRRSNPATRSVKYFKFSVQHYKFLLFLDIVMLFAFFIFFLDCHDSLAMTEVGRLAMMAEVIKSLLLLFHM
jgi:hypothetical protein